MNQLVYGALSTHRQTEPDKLPVPLFARSLIYESKTVRGFWLYRWFQTATPGQIRGALANVFQLAGGGVLRIPEGTPVRPEDAAGGAAPGGGSRPYGETAADIRPAVNRRAIAAANRR